jgi:hypothetical protein
MQTIGTQKARKRSFPLLKQEAPTVFLRFCRNKCKFTRPSFRFVLSVRPDIGTGQRALVRVARLPGVGSSRFGHYGDFSCV